MMIFCALLGRKTFKLKFKAINLELTIRKILLENFLQFCLELDTKVKGGYSGAWRTEIKSSLTVLKDP